MKVEGLPPQAVLLLDGCRVVVYGGNKYIGEFRFFGLADGRAARDKAASDEEDKQRALLEAESSEQRLASELANYKSQRDSIRKQIDSLDDTQQPRSKHNAAQREQLVKQIEEAIAKVEQLDGEHRAAVKERAHREKAHKRAQENRAHGSAICERADVAYTKARSRLE